MDFSSVLKKHGEQAIRPALLSVMRRIRGVISANVGRARDGVLVLSTEELTVDAICIIAALDGSPFTPEEKDALIRKAWELL